MRFNPFRRAPRPEPVLLQITPPRTGERTLLGIENLLQSIAAPEPFSLELSAGENGIKLMIRCLSDELVMGQVASHYPQARIHEISEDADPTRLRDGEQAWSLSLRSSGPEYVPLRIFQDRDLVDTGSDPLLAPLGALSALAEGERLIARLKLQALGPDWSRHHQERTQLKPLQPQQHSTSPPPKSGPEPLAMTVLGLAAFGAFQGYTWLQAGEIWNLVALCAGASFTLLGGHWVWRKWNKSRNRYFDPQLIKEKVSRGAFLAELELVCVLPAGAEPSRAEDLLSRVASAYSHYDHPSGAQFRAGKLCPLPPVAPSLYPQPPGLFRKRSVLGVREVAALWHPPGASDETHDLQRSGAKVLLPPKDELREGAKVGRTTGDEPRNVYFPEDLAQRHHLYVARTRMGKSTLMRHLVEHQLAEKAAGRNRDAVVVIDPHAELVAAILEQVPDSLADQVRLIDLADDRGAVGINLLDAHIFTDRDRTADAVVRVARGLWEQWGPRMQSILEQTVKTLHEANSHPLTEREDQHTIIDGLRLLADDPYRNTVLTRLSDPYILEWWARDFGGWRKEYRAEALAPVQTRLNYYASSKRARAILGQSRSTIDLRRTILDGGILLVSTAQGTVGRDVAALVGASLLNLVDAVIREQEQLPQLERRGALVVVDEMQTIPGVPFESMLSELGKYGARFVLATQSLRKLDDLSPTMRHTLLANTGCLAAFQVSGIDARELVWEMGKERLSEEDLVGQPAHHCYVRASVGTKRLPAFSMTVRKPELGDPDRAHRIREAAHEYTTSAEQLQVQQIERQRRLKEFQQQLAERDESEAATEPDQSEAKSRRVRSRRMEQPQ